MDPHSRPHVLGLASSMICFLFKIQLVHIQNIFVSSLSATTSSIAYILLKFSDQKCLSKKQMQTADTRRRLL